MLQRPESDTLTSEARYGQFVNPQWVRLMSVLGLNRNFIRSAGMELSTDKNETYYDLLSGYGVYNAGHHHPRISAALIEELQSKRPTMLQSNIPQLAGELAERLCSLAGGKAEKVFFTNTGSEGVESAIKFSRAFTKRNWILAADGAFHGLTCGALSLMSNQWWREGFGNLLRETHTIPFGDLDALGKELSTRKYASFIVEPIQGESGIKIPSQDYLRGAQALCEEYGTLLVLDEVQTGLHRTGPFLASHQFGVQPDMTILAKALSGGLVPVGALLMRSDISASVYSSIDKSFVHASTFGENTLAMRAGLATLDVLQEERLGERSTTMGEFFRSALRERLADAEIVREVRGIGLFNGIEFQPPKAIGLRFLFNSLRTAHPGLFGQMVVRSLFQDERILCQMAGNNYMVIKFVPPLTVTKEELTKCADAISRICHSITHDKAKFWSHGAAIAKQVFL